MPEKMENFDQESIIENFEAMSKDAERVQRETLHRILEKNKETEYLKNLGLEGRTDPETFKARVPLVSHEVLEPYIQRIVDGDPSPILTSERITTMSLSSGTTQGRPKFVPFNEDLLDDTVQIFQTSFAFRNREYPIENGKALQFIYGSKQFKTVGGLTASTATSNINRTDKIKNAMKNMGCESCSPEEVIDSSDFNQALYCHLLCGLIYSNEVQFVASTFAHSIVHAFRIFEEVWEELCSDIREGILTNRITLPSIRTAMSKILKSDPDLADSIYKKCSSFNDFYGLIPELWPQAKYVYGIMTGSMEPYLKKLRQYAGHLPLLSADYGSSEGWVAANVNPTLPPESARFTVVPNIGYFEFIPLREKTELETTINTLSSHEAEPVGLTEVNIGEEYEIIVTNFGGFYRYRLGDVVKVVSFHNSIPELKFICRRNLVLNINIDKNTEKDLQLAVEEAAKVLQNEEKVEVLDFTSHVDTSTVPGHYVIFFELNGSASNEVLCKCCNSLDRSFIDAGYVSSRKINSIGALELRIVNRGTFHKILNHYLGLGAALNQFKTPRCVGSNNIKVLEILDSNVSKRYFSTVFS